jgi:pyridoxal phosphate enzyme (YggS family)
MEIIAEPPLTAELIRERHQGLLPRLREAAQGGGHDPDRLRIVAVTKTWPVEVCQAALDAGIGMLGENRVQEAEPKIARLPDADWHLVGHLQSNKARRAVRAFAVIHSIDSVELLRRVDEIAHDEGRRPRVLLEVNLSGETTKAGFEPEAFEGDARDRSSELVAALREVRTAQVVGLMTMARLGAVGEEARAAFRRLRTMRDRLRDSSGLELPELSMGMTVDAEDAAAEGATLVRIGTALFGPRRE